MSTDHRKPLVVFVLLAVAAVVLVVQRADAEAGRWLEAAGAAARVHGAVLPDASGSPATGRTARLGPALEAVGPPTPNRLRPGPWGHPRVSADPGDRPYFAVSRDEERHSLRSSDPGVRRRGHSDARNAREGRGADGPAHAGRSHIRGRAAAEARSLGRALRRNDGRSVKHED